MPISKGPSKAKQIFLAAGAVIFSAVFAVAAFGLTRYPIPDVSAFPVDIEEVRRLASLDPQSLPLELRSLEVGIGAIPRHFVVGGWNFGIQSLPTYAYQIIYDNGYVMVDAVNDKETQFEAFPWSDFRPENYARMQEVLRGANAIVLTHEHFDHSTGIPRSPYFAEIAPKVRMTSEQLRSPEMKQAKFTAEHLAALVPLEYDRFHVLAPGVVLIKAPGHTPGSQLIFIRLRNGGEFLLAGDVAWHMDNIGRPTMHPRWMNWGLKEDAQAMAHQLRWLHDLKRSDPQLHIVVAHDGEQMRDYIAGGLLYEGLRDAGEFQK
jgi:glyoxylase-like metal-dependent hydrolase (beta-lactamase superfamily II)